MSDFDAALESILGPQLPAHLYVHVPFCASKCAYCDFASVAGADDALVEAVFAGIRTQLSHWSRSGLEGVLDTIYVGGGTPTLAAEQVAELLSWVRRHFVVHPAAEITVEANPDSLDARVVALLAEAGATRISVGVQSFDDTVLRMLGRRHDAASALRAALAVVDGGLDLSVDLICGVPEQTITSWSETLERAAATGAHHASVYPLSIEEGTPFDAAIGAGLVAEPDPDVAAEMMVLAEESLGYHALGRYEVANYAEDRAHESRHNTAYWTGRSYLGVGPGAHGMLDAPTALAAGIVRELGPELARVRYANAASIEDWLVVQGDTAETLTAEEAAREDVMLGMRLTRGVPAGQVAAAGLTRTLESLAADGLVTLAGEDAAARWCTTRRGWLLGNEVFGRIWSAGE